MKKVSISAKVASKGVAEAFMKLNQFKTKFIKFIKWTVF